MNYLSIFHSVPALPIKKEDLGISIPEFKAKEF